MTGGKVLPGEVLQQIVAKSVSVPLFVEEVTRTVIESGSLKDANRRLIGDARYRKCGAADPTCQGSCSARRLFLMFLLDTNVISELRKVRAGKADKNVARWADGVDAADLYLSLISLQELQIGVLLVGRRDQAQGAPLSMWLNEHVLTAFRDRILSVDAAVALRSAQLHVPDPRPVRDSLIAATARVHRMTVVTRNRADFARMGVSLLNPWEDSP